MNVSVVAGRPSVSTGDDQGISYAPIASAERLNFIGTSMEAVYKALETAFGGSWPIRLDRSHLPTLRGMAAAAGDGCMPYNELHSALERYGALEVTLT